MSELSFTPKLVSELGFPKDRGDYILYYRDGKISKESLVVGMPYDGHPFKGLLAWLPIPPMPITDEFEQAWEQWEDSYLALESKGFIRAGWEMRDKWEARKGKQ